MTPKVLQARKAVSRDATLYRAGKLGRSENAEGQFWALEQPGHSTTYAQRHGIPSQNMQFDFVQGGHLKPGSKFITRKIPPVGPNSGGAIEVVTNPNTVPLRFFSNSQITNQLAIQPH